MLIKRLVEFIVTLLYLLLAGVLFMLLSSVCYVPEGRVGTADGISTMLSVLFIVSLPVLFLVLGRRHAIGAYAALSIVFVHFMLVGIMEYLGLAAAHTAFGYPFYITLAPFAPLIESLCTTFSIDRAGIYVQLLLPMAVCGLTMLAYLIAHNGANRRAVEKNYERMRRQEEAE